MGLSLWCCFYKCIDSYKPYGCPGSTNQYGQVYLFSWQPDNGLAPKHICHHLVAAWKRSFPDLGDNLDVNLSSSKGIFGCKERQFSMKKEKVFPRKGEVCFSSCLVGGITEKEKSHFLLYSLECLKRMWKVRGPWRVRKMVRKRWRCSENIHVCFRRFWAEKC